MSTPRLLPSSLGRHNPLRMNLQTCTSPARFLSTSARQISTTRCLSTLPDSSVSTFRDRAFTPCTPALLPRNQFAKLPAVEKWFTTPKSSKTPHLNRSYLDPFGGALVPLEYTAGRDSFQRTAAPLSVFLQWTSLAQSQDQSRFYLAQAPLSKLPGLLQDDLPTPEVVLKAGKGDVYDANVWIGIAPTYTPLHRDPNPNLFVQLAGSKIVRLLDPHAGDRVFENVQRRLGRNANKVFRGEEMMRGNERKLLDEEVWAIDGCGREVRLDRGDALFIPKGWWHCIQGVEDGVTASANWWFR